MELAKISEQGVEITFCDPAVAAESANNAKLEYDNAVASGLEEGLEVLKKRSEALAEIAEAEQARHEDLLTGGYLPFVPAERPEDAEDKIAVDTFDVREGKVHQSWVMQFDKRIYQKQIDILKAEIAASDYKMTKCAEANLVGLPLPYDIHALHEERESLREQIRALELKL